MKENDTERALSEGLGEFDPACWPNCPKKVEKVPKDDEEIIDPKDT